MLLGEKAKSMAMVLGQMVAEQLAGCQRRLIIGRTTQSRRGCMRSITVQIWMISHSVSIVSVQLGVRFYGINCILQLMF